MADDITKRMNYFDRQFLRAKDFQVEQAYHLDRRRRHNRSFHSAGVADMPNGLEVKPKPGTTNQVTVQPGWAVDEDGREIIVLLPGRDLTITHSGAGSVEIYISYPDPEPLSDKNPDPGPEKFTRVHEQAVLTRVPGDAASQPAKSLPLATVSVDGSGNITNVIDRRQPAGIATKNILDNAITSDKIAGGAVTEPKLANDAVSTRTIADGAVTEPKLANDAVSTRTIADSAITEPKLANDAITSPKIADADGASGQDTTTGAGVKEGHIQNNAVSASKLRADAADANDAQRAVTTDHIRNLNVTTPKLADGAVTAAKLQSHPNDNTQRAVGKQHIQNGSVSIAQLSAGVVLDAQFNVPAAPAAGQTAELVVNIQEADAHAFYLISLHFDGPRPLVPPPIGFSRFFEWKHRVALIKFPGQPPNLHRHFHQLVIQNPNTFVITVSCKVYRLSET